MLCRCGIRFTRPCAINPVCPGLMVQISYSIQRHPEPSSHKSLLRDLLLTPGPSLPHYRVLLSADRAESMADMANLHANLNSLSALLSKRASPSVLNPLCSAPQVHCSALSTSSQRQHHSLRQEPPKNEATHPPLLRACIPVFCTSFPSLTRLSRRSRASPPLERSGGSSSGRSVRSLGR